MSLVQKFIAKCTAENKCNGEIVQVLQFTAGTTPEEKDEYLGERTEEGPGRFKREEVEIEHYIVDAGSQGSTFSEYHLKYIDEDLSKAEFAKWAKKEGFSVDDKASKESMVDSIKAQIEAKHPPILDWQNRARLEYKPVKDGEGYTYQLVHAWPGLPPG